MMVTGLTSDNERFLEQAVAAGVFPTREDALNQAVQALREKAKAVPSQVSKAKLSGEEWERAFREWAASHPRTTHFVDDSRESIYEGRGE
jgi:Arc/MetJ-type ribon-helix-helix transcriptional regulator